MSFSYKKISQRAEYSKREGSDRDVKELEIVWRKFGCTVNTLKNLDKSQLLKSLKDFQKQVTTKLWQITRPRFAIRKRTTIRPIFGVE